MRTPSLPGRDSNTARTTFVRRLRLTLRTRSASWTEGEAVRLFERAWRDGHRSLAAVIAAAWSTQLSPGDVRQLRAAQLVKRVDSGAVFFIERRGSRSVTPSATVPLRLWR